MKQAGQVVYGLVMLLFVATYCTGPLSTVPPTSLPLPTRTFLPTPHPSTTATPLTRSGTTQVVPTPQPAEITYAALLAQVKQADPGVDFTALRMAYAQTAAYNPYSGEQAELQKAMYAALDNNDYNSALKLAMQILDQNYIAPDAHMVALYAYEALGQQTEADFHRYVLRGLIKSVLASGDGKSPETAFTVVLIDEEYMVLSVLGIEDASQRLIEDQGHWYDVFEGVDTASKTQVTLYFNIDVLRQWLRNSLSPSLGGAPRRLFEKGTPAPGRIPTARGVTTDVRGTIR